MTYTLNKKYTLFYYIAIALIAILLAIFYYNTLVVKSSEKMVNHTNLVINKTNEILLDIINIETGVRGFALTNNKAFLAPYNESLNQINQDINALLLLTKDNPNQQIRVKKLKESIAERIGLSKLLIDNKKKNGGNKDIELAAILKGKIAMDAIRLNIKTINSEELALLKERKDENVSSVKLSKISLFGLFLFLVLLVIFIYYLSKNHNKRNAELELHNKHQKDVSQYSLSLIEASLDPLVTINNEGKITDLNQATVKVTGIEKEQLIGSDFINYFTDHQKALEVYLDVFANGSVVDAPLTIRHKNGKLTDVLFNGSVYKDELGVIKGVVIVARDIAEQKWALDLRSANNELAYQNEEKEKRAAELVIANEELAFQNEEKENRANELILANEELAYQNQEKENRAEELVLANKELEYQNKIKEKKAAELVIANKELAFQKDEKQNRADELEIANKELLFQIDEKQNRADELEIADKELNFQNEEKEKRVLESKVLEAYTDSLELASQYSLSLIEASRDPLFTISPEGKITDTNQASVRVTHVSKEDLLGSDFITYFTDPQKAKEGYEEVFAKGFVVDYPLTIKDHKLTDVLFNGSVYKNDKGNVIGAVVVARDITEQKKAEKELIEAKIYAELATSIAEDAKVIAETATTKAEEAVKSKQQFLSNMSHEIRTPMNAIIGFTKVVLKTELTAKQKEYLTAIKMSGDALIVLINDILDLAKVDAGKMTFEKTPFKLHLSIKAMLHLFETKIQEKNLKLITHYDKNIPEVLLGDSVRLHQIILNLVSNAVKFTNEGKITVSVNLQSETDEEVLLKFAIADTGIGIKETKTEKIFENFQQATSGTSRIFGGTGLGLAIVKQLVEAQKGTITVDSTFGKGSTFSFILKFMKTNADAVLEPEILELNTDIKDTKILVVEDMELNQLLMKTLLDDFGFECEIAANGKIAVEKLKKNNYDIVLMDLQMPEMNGFEATEYIRKTMKLTLPIIALTADVTTVDVAKCKEVGMNDYISKPVDERLLYSKLIGLIKKPVVIIEHVIDGENETDMIKYVDLSYLTKLTKSNPKLMTEMIQAYLKQTPPLISSMKESHKNKDWLLLKATVHKMIPSFAIMGINPQFTELAKKIQEYAERLEASVELNELVVKLEKVCVQSCSELENELNNLNK
ncbi:CHASE3 domain-containing protein [Flavobacterium paronense]|uniref:histidine kinase n=1 Tax=Flavobacterium paronense TaxID=1392775 RepID=A0ABV5GBM9_9FLAO|nr:CHASE3 domain-containing protein [Flavobacterium paronense]MDN3677636.1 CHASE3 domain-containing protein [Flavobacterium paronense]